MPSYNKVIIMGNLTRSPELKYIQSGTAVCKFGLAVNEKYKKGDEWVESPVYIDITVWGKQGENCAEYLRKGRPVLIDGRLQFSQWEADGQKRSKLDVVANSVQFLGGREDKKTDAPASETGDIPF